jgi:hypothetical protein
MMLFPFSLKDDLVDATSRLYDLNPRPAVLLDGVDDAAAAEARQRG